MRTARGYRALQASIHDVGRERGEQCVLDLLEQCAVGGIERARLSGLEPDRAPRGLQVSPARLGAGERGRQGELELNPRRSRGRAARMACKTLRAVVGQDLHVGSRAKSPQHLPELVVELVAGVALREIVQVDDDVVRPPSCGARRRCHRGFTGRCEERRHEDPRGQLCQPLSDATGLLHLALLRSVAV